MEPTINIAQVILSLLIVVGLIGLCALALKRMQRTQGWLNKLAQGQHVSVVERMMIDARTRLVVAKWKQREYLILITPQGAEVLDVEECESHADQK